MLSKSQISLLSSLQHKKFRREHGLFMVEGYKSVTEFINSAYQVDTIYHTPAIAPKLLNLSRKINFQEISLNELQKISSLKTPQEVIGLVKIPIWPVLNYKALEKKFSLVLDSIQDPGNMGTIIRTADWFGIQDIICSEDTVDVYNPKVVQATMGSLARVNVHYADLLNVLPQIKLPIFGAMLNGENIYNTHFGTEGLLVMGNEGNGISAPVEQLITSAVTIPRAGNAESLNVAIATAILCSEIKRKSMK
ncbi:RNA methyltransferase, TrmH family [Mucilaginibacter lappiensis]|uniref:TrmH family RNA methyltransferase n=1 Tax=Mucilaginibacter lappiensis TaxID=354630 RepID=A0ABR6PQL3_9SPHI|nr:RNA methyltransferase [Mucilaginibacter lappiensis]MBB6112069.1 TrmH family RNA methyltransferase [Mucilaginibacter lappiensis]SIR95146.1 RNA methyltransferase, TrmH family [Mucilaginibacter lappiensis]